MTTEENAGQVDDQAEYQGVGIAGALDWVQSQSQLDQRESNGVHRRKGNEGRGVVSGQAIAGGQAAGGGNVCDRIRRKADSMGGCGYNDENESRQ